MRTSGSMPTSSPALIGTCEQVAAGLAELSAAGLDGCLLGWVDFDTGMRLFRSRTLPLLEQMGLR